MYYCSLCVQTSGQTAIFFAIEKSNLEIIEMLIKGGARLDIKDNVSLSLSLLFYLGVIFYHPLSCTLFLERPDSI
jgi:ankyrin repeat protein